MTEPFESAVDRAINSGFAQRGTMSFSLFTVFAEAFQEGKTRPGKPGRGDAFPASHGRTGCSGCTPAEPYPPSRGHKPNEPVRPNQAKKAMPAISFTQRSDQSKGLL